jgi:hypothetical protein
MQSEESLHEKRVPHGLGRISNDSIQGLFSISPKTAGGILCWKAENRFYVTVGKKAQQQAAWSPIQDSNSSDITGTNCDIHAIEFFSNPWKVFWIVAEVSVESEDKVGLKLQRFLKSFKYSRAITKFSGSDDGDNPGILFLKLAEIFRSAVRGAVIDDDDGGFGQNRPDCWDQSDKIRELLVCGQYDAYQRGASWVDGLELVWEAEAPNLISPWYTASRIKGLQARISPSYLNTLWRGMSSPDGF